MPLFIRDGKVVIADGGLIQVEGTSCCCGSACCPHCPCVKEQCCYEGSESYCDSIHGEWHEDTKCVDIDCGECKGCPHSSQYVESHNVAQWQLPTSFSVSYDVHYWLFESAKISRWFGGQEDPFEETVNGNGETVSACQSRGYGMDTCCCEFLVAGLPHHDTCWHNIELFYRYEPTCYEKHRDAVNPYPRFYGEAPQLRTESHTVTMWKDDRFTTTGCHGVYFGQEEEDYSSLTPASPTVADITGCDGAYPVSLLDYTVDSKYRRFTAHVSLSMAAKGSWCCYDAYPEATWDCIGSVYSTPAPTYCTSPSEGEGRPQETSIGACTRYQGATCADIEKGGGCGTAPRGVCCSYHTAGTTCSDYFIPAEFCASLCSAPSCVYHAIKTGYSCTEFDCDDPTDWALYEKDDTSCSYYPQVVINLSMDQCSISPCPCDDEVYPGYSNRFLAAMSTVDAPPPYHGSVYQEDLPPCPSYPDCCWGGSDVTAKTYMFNFYPHLNIFNSLIGLIPEEDFGPPNPPSSHGYLFIGTDTTWSVEGECDTSNLDHVSMCPHPQAAFDNVVLHRNTTPCDVAWSASDLSGTSISMETNLNTTSCDSTCCCDAGAGNFTKWTPCPHITDPFDVNTGICMHGTPGYERNCHSSNCTCTEWFRTDMSQGASPTAEKECPEGSCCCGGLCDDCSQNCLTKCYCEFASTDCLETNVVCNQHVPPACGSTLPDCEQGCTDSCVYAECNRDCHDSIAHTAGSQGCGLKDGSALPVPTWDATIPCTSRCAIQDRTYCSCCGVPDNWDCATVGCCYPDPSNNVVMVDADLLYAENYAGELFGWTDCKASGTYYGSTSYLSCGCQEPYLSANHIYQLETNECSACAPYDNDWGDTPCGIRSVYSTFESGVEFAQSGFRFLNWSVNISPQYTHAAPEECD
jgi:hypothetical protein